MIFYLHDKRTPYPTFPRKSWSKCGQQEEGHPVDWLKKPIYGAVCQKELIPTRCGEP